MTSSRAVPARERETVYNRTGPNTRLYRARRRDKHAEPASIAVATEIHQFNAVYKAYSESFRKNKE